MSKQELIVLTHNDLDALGTILNIEYKFPTQPKKYFFTNYANIDKIVQEMKNYISDKGLINPNIFITDVSFSDSKQSLRDIYALGKCLHIDHHLYPSGFWDEFPDMKVHHSTKKSATLLCNEFFGNTGKCKNLDTLTRYIDVYDLWQSDEKEFKTSQLINAYFWERGIDDLSTEIIQNNFNLPIDFKSTVQSIQNRAKMDIAAYESKGAIKRSGIITLAFVDKWFNEILVSEMEKGQHFVIGCGSWGIMKIRIKQKTPYNDEVLNSLRLFLTGTETIGHMHAFTYKIKGSVSFDNIIKEAQIITNKINEIIESNNKGVLYYNNTNGEVILEEDIPF